MAQEEFPDGIEVTKETIYVGKQPISFELPQRYYDWSFVMTHFPAPTRRVRELLPDDGLVPVELLPQLAVVTLAAFDYRRMATLAPYKEFAIMVPVRYRPKRNIPFLPLLSPEAYEVGFWVHHLPVTTAEAREAGLALWGFPKVLADIEFADVGWHRRCTLSERGADIVTLSSPMGETRREARQFFAFSAHNGELLKTLVDTRGEYYAWNVPGRASFELGPHPIADELRHLEVQNFAVAGLFAFSARSRLHPGIAVATGEAGGA